MSTEHLLIIGASARAAAFSAIRAGFMPHCADLFADRDLAALDPVMRIPGADYPQGLGRLLESSPARSWMYTGALENHPDLIDRWAAKRHLWGNGGLILQKVRDPRWLCQTLTQAGFSFPEVIPASQKPDPKKRWLIKPLRGAAGKGISFWTKPISQLPPGFYLQEFIAGPSFAAIFVGGANQAILLGVTKQWVGSALFHAPEFGYCGSAGPVVLNRSVLQALLNLGQILTAKAGLQGLFGIDFILDGKLPRPVEVNPRYTASIEVLELATGVKALQLHQKAFIDPDGLREFISHPKVLFVGKAILFAKKDLTFPRKGPWDRQIGRVPYLNDLPAYADIPAPGERIPRGRPILTMLVQAHSTGKALESLQEIAAKLDRDYFND